MKVYIVFALIDEVDMSARLLVKIFSTKKSAIAYINSIPDTIFEVEKWEVQE